MDQVEEISIDIEKARTLIDTMNAFERLRKNKDFILVIEKLYFEDESKRLVLLLSDINMQDDLSQKELQNGITGVGQLFQYFRTIKGLGVQAEGSLRADLETQSELSEAGDDDE